MNTILDQIGIRPQAQKIYLALIDVGQASMSDLVRSTDLHRPTVYKHIAELVQLGLIGSSIVGKRTRYFAHNPDRLVRIADAIPSQMQTFVESLKIQYERSHGRPELTWYQGSDAATWVYEDVLRSCKKGDVFFRYESPKDYTAIDAHLPAEYFERICKKKEVEKYVITNEKTAKEKPAVLERVSRYVPTEFDIFDYDITQIIYADKVAFLDIQNGSAWIVENSRFAHFQRRLFQLLFRTLE